MCPQGIPAEYQVTGSETQSETFASGRAEQIPLAWGQTEHCFSSVGDHDNGIGLCPGKWSPAAGGLNQECSAKTNKGLNGYLLFQRKKLLILEPSPSSSFLWLEKSCFWRLSGLGCRWVGKQASEANWLSLLHRFWLLRQALRPFWISPAAGQNRLSINSPASHVGTRWVTPAPHPTLTTSHFRAADHTGGLCVTKFTCENTFIFNY